MHMNVLLIWHYKTAEIIYPITLGEALFLFCRQKLSVSTIFGSDNLKLSMSKLLLALLSEQILAQLLNQHFWSPKIVGVTFGPFENVGPTKEPKVGPTFLRA